MNFYHVTKFSIELSFTVHYNYTKIGKFLLILSIRIVLSCFYLLISHFENLSTLPFAVNAMLSFSNVVSNLVSMRFTAETLGLLKMQKFTPASMKGWTYVNTVRTVLSEQKFLGCIDNQIFLPMVLRCGRESSAIVS